MMARPRVCSGWDKMCVPFTSLRAVCAILCGGRFQPEEIISVMKAMRACLVR